MLRCGKGPVLNGTWRKSNHDSLYSQRVEVFHHEQKFPLDTEFDASVNSSSRVCRPAGLTPISSYDSISAHFLLRLTPSLIPVGTVRAYKSPDANYYKLSRLAVLKDYRKFGFGRQLVSALHDWVAADARQKGEIRFTEVISHSQLHAKGFYGK
jgi:GNAT superfamily N-acetyltransferase